jgi:hypothetical protein
VGVDRTPQKNLHFKKLHPKLEFHLILCGFQEQQHLHMSANVNVEHPVEDIPNQAGDSQTLALKIIALLSLNRSFISGLHRKINVGPKG